MTDQQSNNADKTAQSQLNTVKLGSKLPFSAQTVGDYFFADETGTLPEVLNFKEVDLIYNDYIRVMTCMYQKLRHTYNQFVLKLLTDEQRNEYKLEPESNGLIMPGNEG